MLSGSTLFILPLAIWRDGLPSLDYAGETWLAMVYLSVVATALAYLRITACWPRRGRAMFFWSPCWWPLWRFCWARWCWTRRCPLRAYAGFALLASGLVVIDGRILNRRRAAGAAVPPA